MPVTGITGTPAIAGTSLYAVAFLSGYRHVLFALDLKRGKVEFRRQVDAPGSDPRVHQERSALSVSHGRVYVPFGGLAGDCGDYRGRVVSVRTSRPRKRRSFTVGVGREGGIWGPSGAAVDRRGNLFVATGNGDSFSGFDYGNAVLRLSSNLALTSFFRPANASQLNQTDSDLGSVGPTLLGGGLLFAIGKEGVGAVLSTSSLGGVGGQLFQQLLPLCSEGAFGGVAYLPPLIFVPCSRGLVAVRLSGSQFATAWQAPFSAGPPIVAGGVVWSIDIDRGTLNGYAPGSGALVATAPLGSQVTHFTTPAAGGGRLFAASNDQLIAFAGI